jgi:two-component system phosphate regulon sensor histidine kinase PhoR
VRKLRLNIILLLGLVAIIGILAVQLFLLRSAYKDQGTRFAQQVQVTLLKVVDRLYEFSDHEFPLQNPVKKITNDYYIVNVNNDFDPSLLEYCLRKEFEEAQLLVDFEYAVYKCASDEMVLGNYVSFNRNETRKTNFHFLKDKNLVYYFALRFPDQLPVYFTHLWLYIILAGILVVILIIYLYSVFTILQQKRYTELQKDFINNMTHEFKTPLSSMLIAARYLHKQPTVAADDRMSQYSKIIIDQSIKLNAHIEKILDIAKRDHSPMLLEMEEIHLVPLLKEVCENLQLKTPFRYKIIASNLDCTIRADKFHLTNLVFNAIDNSVKYADKEPYIELKVEQLKGNLKLDISDNGIGIPTENLELVFEKFYRVKRDNSSHRNGFGLGLYYVRKICQMHKWKVELFNNQGPGVTLSLLIPHV